MAYFPEYIQTMNGFYFLLRLLYSRKIKPDGLKTRQVLFYLQLVRSLELLQQLLGKLSRLALLDQQIFGPVKDTTP